MAISTAIQQLMALLQKNPDLVTKLTSMVNMDEAVALVKSKGVEIAKAELQKYIAENLMKKASGDVLKNIATGAAGDLLKGVLGGK